MKLYRTSNGVLVEQNDNFYLLPVEDWDESISSSDLCTRVREVIGKRAASSFDPATVLAPVVSQEVWAAGVTYYRSRNARIDESKDAEEAVSTTESTQPKGRTLFQSDGATRRWARVRRAYPVSTPSGRCLSRS